MKKILLVGLSAFLMDNDCGAFDHAEAHRCARPHVATSTLQPKAVLKKKRLAELRKKRLAEQEKKRLEERRKKRIAAHRAELEKKRQEELRKKRMEARRAEQEKKRIAEHKAELEKKRQEELRKKRMEARRAEQEKKRIAERKAELERKRQEELRRKRIAERNIEQEKKRIAERKAELERKRVAERKAELERKRIAERRASAAKVAAASKSPVAKPAAQTTAARLAAQAALKRQSAAVANATPRKNATRVIVEPARPKSAPAISSRTQSPAPVVMERSSSAPAISSIGQPTGTSVTIPGGIKLIEINTIGDDSCGYRAIDINESHANDGSARSEKALSRQVQVQKLIDNLDETTIDLVAPEVAAFVALSKPQEILGLRGADLLQHFHRNRNDVIDYLKHVKCSSVWAGLPTHDGYGLSATGTLDAIAYRGGFELFIVARRDMSIVETSGEDGNLEPRLVTYKAGSILHHYRPSNVSRAPVYMMYNGNNHFTRAKVVGQ